jgi:hypothetical protein
MLELIDVGVIGTAFRKEEANLLTADLFNKMCQHFKGLIDTQAIKSVDYRWISAISGGAAGADGLAVVAMYHGWIKSLTLCIPGRFDINKKLFVNTDVSGKHIADDSSISTANYYHAQFKAKTGIDLCDMISVCAKKSGVKFESYYNFYQRNLEIAKRARILVAYTYGQDEPGSSGTMSTWRAHEREGNGQRKHYNIGGL